MFFQFAELVIIKYLTNLIFCVFENSLKSGTSRPPSNLFPIIVHCVVRFILSRELFQRNLKLIESIVFITSLGVIMFCAKYTKGNSNVLITVIFPKYVSFLLFQLLI